jgi:putative endonuclease
MLDWLKKIIATTKRFLFSWNWREPIRTSSTRQVGNDAEEAAYRYLRKKGYRIVARNYRRRFGEIDLIGWDGNFLAFIEVKYRSGVSHGLPTTAVHRHKQRQICRLAKEYRIRHKLHDINFRFDVVSVREALDHPAIELIKGAFSDPTR